MTSNPLLKFPKLLKPRRFPDQRGFLQELFHPRVRTSGPELEDFFVRQVIHTSSGYGTLRGLHWQFPFGMEKLVTCLAGDCIDVAVDIRTDSPDFGAIYWTHLDGASGNRLFVPAGFAHGYLAISHIPPQVLYLCSDIHYPQCSRSLRWNDPQLQIPWPARVMQHLVVDEATKKAPCLADLPLADLPYHTAPNLMAVLNRRLVQLQAE